jgi:hypothetical protein
MEIASSIVPLQRKSAQNCIRTSTSETPNDFLRQIESVDSSGLAKFSIETLELIERRLRSSKGKIDIITFEGVATEFLKRAIDLYNRYTEKPRLEMGNEDDSNRNH